MFDFHTLAQQLINGVATGGMYALIALGYTMVYGIIELINFAHGDVYTLGSFFSLSILALLPIAGVTSGPLLVLIAIGVIILAALLCGITAPSANAPKIALNPTIWPPSAQSSSATKMVARTPWVIRPRLP